MNRTDPQRPALHDALLDGREVQVVTKLSGRTLLRLAERGLMPAPIKVGAQNRWSRNAIEAWLATGCPAIGKEAGHVG